MAKEKRTKPCSNCKKSKVKCIYSSTLPCERCIKSGQAANCQFVPKLPSLKLPQISPLPDVNGKNESDITLPPLNPMTNVSSNQANRILQGYIIHSAPQKNMPVVATGAIGQQDVNDSQWKQQIENRISTFDNKLNDLVDILKTNQKVLLEQQQMAYKQMPYQQPQQNTMQYGSFNYGHLASSAHSSRITYRTKEQPSHHNNYNDLTPTDHEMRRRIINEDIDGVGPRKRHKSEGESDRDVFSKPDDFRDGFLNIQQARELFRFFDAHISPQLFGFEISKFTVDSLWESSPILICAICTIASMHHPQKELAIKLKQLHCYLHDLCGSLLYQGRPKNEIDGFNTIVALVLCSFWLSDSQMFTGLALQLAKEIGLDSPISKRDQNNNLSEKDRIKLWYLLYVLDGQQSLTFNRQPLVNSQEYTLKNSRSILLNEGNLALLSETPHSEEKREKPLIQKQNERKESFPDIRSQETARKQRFTDMRLVSQVEYNQALNEAFKGNAWELLAPSALGIPSKSNLELDKWMVSWTVLLSPVSNGSVWSSKSTLIYYNFAKMHINSSAVRQLQMDTSERSMFPKWDQSIRPQNSQRKKLVHIDNQVDSEDDSDDDEFISNRDHISDDETAVSASIAVNAAQTVLNLVLNDNDILNNLKYVPVHIHIMLYYASLLLVNPPLDSGKKSVDFKPEEHFNKILSNLRVVKLLQKKIYANLPTDKTFGDRLIRSLTEIIEENSSKLRIELNNSGEMDESVKSELKAKLRDIEDMQANNIVELMEDGYDSNSSGSCTPGPEKIFAWPGSNHGHP